MLTRALDSSQFGHRLEFFRLDVEQEQLGIVAHEQLRLLAQRKQIVAGRTILTIG